MHPAEAVSSAPRRKTLLNKKRRLYGLKLACLPRRLCGSAPARRFRPGRKRPHGKTSFLWLPSIELAEFNYRSLGRRRGDRQQLSPRRKTQRMQTFKGKMQVLRLASGITCCANSGRNEFGRLVQDDRVLDRSLELIFQGKMQVPSASHRPGSSARVWITCCAKIGRNEFGKLGVVSRKFVSDREQKQPRILRLAAPN
jgi:hypothetical protein